MGFLVLGCAGGGGVLRPGPARRAGAGTPPAFRQ